jgi:hypothetical protein
LTNPPQKHKSSNGTIGSSRIRTASDDAHKLVPETLLLVTFFGVLSILLAIDRGYPTVSLIA